MKLFPGCKVLLEPDAEVVLDELDAGVMLDVRDEVEDVITFEVILILLVDAGVEVATPWRH